MNWSEEWNSSIKESSYLKILNEKGISNNDFWKNLDYYDELMKYSGYPGKILDRISTFIFPEDILLDIGSGAGAFALPLSKISNKLIALDPSPYQLSILKSKAEADKCDNILYIGKEWKNVSKYEIGHVDYSLAAYSFFEDDIYSFLEKLIYVATKGIFLVFRAGRGDPLREYVYNNKNSVDFLHLYNILSEMGYIFNVEIFTSDYKLPLPFVYRSYPYSIKTEDEIFNYLNENNRLIKKQNFYEVLCQRKDALLYLIK